MNNSWKLAIWVFTSLCLCILALPSEALSVATGSHGSKGSKSSKKAAFTADASISKYKLRQLAEKTSSAKKTDEAAELEKDQVRKVLLDLGTAINAADLEKTISMWTEDSSFIDESGQLTQGRAALKEKFSSLFQQRKADSVTLHPQKINIFVPGVAMVVGEVSRKSGLIELPASSFSMLIIKSASSNTWLISEATETLIQNLSAADHLKELEWLIGNWQVDNLDPPTKLEVNWTEGRNFILSKCIIQRKDGATQVDKQVIGYDPRSKGLVSWHFAFDGGFGYGKWIRQQDNWVLEYSGVGTDGSSSRASNKFTPKSADEFTWQSTRQSNDGQDFPDTPAVTLHRSK